MIYASPMFGRPLRREGGHRIPVIAFTGFLGAGKTTLIRSLLEKPEGANTAVVVNEFGEIGIDQALLRASTDNATVLLGNGCVCCRVLNDVQETLRTLLVDRARGTVPPFERIVIETTGLADPGPLLQTFVSDRVLGADFHLYALICVVDAATVAASLANAPEATKQIALADRVVITKGDLAGAIAVELARQAIAAINPQAPIRVASQGDVDPAFLLEEPVGQARPAHFAEPVRHGNEVVTFPVLLPEPIDWSGFSQAMRILTSLRGPDLLRVKGFVAVRGCAGPVLVQYVQHLAHPPVELQSLPDGDTRSRLKFIVRNIDPASVTALLESAQRIALTDADKGTPP